MKKVNSIEGSINKQNTKILLEYNLYKHTYA
jgi:hypothetical protein